MLDLKAIYLKWKVVDRHENQHQLQSKRILKLNEGQEETHWKTQMWFNLFLKLSLQKIGLIVAFVKCHYRPIWTIVMFAIVAFTNTTIGYGPIMTFIKMLL